MNFTPKLVSALSLCLFGASLFGLLSSCGERAPSDSGSGAAPAKADRADDDRPDLILVTIDAFRPERSSVYGYDQPTTPVLAELAAESLVFERAYTTMPLALPAHASMLTGLLPTTHLVRDDVESSLDNSIPTVSAALAQSGYRTAAFVGSLDLHVKYGLNRGFERYDDAIRRAKLFGHDSSARPASKVVELATEWLAESNGAPAFLLVNLSEPNWARPIDSKASAKFADAYDGRLLAADAALGQLVEALKQQGRYDDCTLIVTSGSGLALGDHGEQGHGYLVYDSTIRVPLLVKLPRGERAERVSALASIVDLPATLLAAAGAEPMTTDGVDLVGLAESADPNRKLYAESFLPTRYERSPLFCLISSEWKYIDSTAPELYHLTEDPRELNNLIESQPERAAEFDAALIEVRGDRTLEGPPSLDFLDEHLCFESLPALLADNEVAQVRAICDGLDAEHPGLAATAYYRMLAEIRDIDADRLESTVELLRGFLTNHPIRRRPVLGKLDPYPSDAGFMLGIELIQVERGSEAIDPLRDALRSRPCEVAGRRALGESLLQLDRKKTGLKELEIAANIEPTADIENTLGVLHAEIGTPEKSHEHLLRAVELDPDKSLYHGNLARSYATRLEWAACFAEFRRSLELEPVQPELELEFAFYLATVNDSDFRDIDAGFEAVARALDHGLPVTAGTLDGVAAVYAAGEAYDLAVQFATRARDLAIEEGDMKHAMRIDQTIETYRYELELLSE